jgi:hypothetical protein
MRITREDTVMMSIFRFVVNTIVFSSRLDGSPVGFLGPSNTEASSSELVEAEERIQAGTSPTNGTSDRPKGAVTRGVASDETKVSNPTCRDRFEPCRGKRVAPATALSQTELSGRKGI